MRPFVRVIGKVLRLVGISSPEDTLARPAAPSDPPSWRSLTSSLAGTKKLNDQRSRYERCVREVIWPILIGMTQ
jgi:hypothetical protein